MKGRACAVCAREGKNRRTRPHLRHMHELEIGDAFRFPHRPKAHRLARKGPLRCEYTTTLRPRRVAFEAAGGEHVEFTASPGSATRPCAPTAEVIPIEEEPCETD